MKVFFLCSKQQPVYASYENNCLGYSYKLEALLCLKPLNLHLDLLTSDWCLKWDKVAGYLCLHIVFVHTCFHLWVRFYWTLYVIMLIIFKCFVQDHNIWRNLPAVHWNWCIIPFSHPCAFSVAQYLTSLSLSLRLTKDLDVCSKLWCQQQEKLGHS